MRAALGATRDTYYDGLQGATGQDFQTLKRAESSLLSYQEALANSKRGLFAAQAEHEAPTTGKQKVAKAGEVAGAVLKGDKAKLAQSALNESPMARTQAHIQRFLKTIPDAVPGGYDASSSYVPNTPRLPSKSTPETINAETTPNPRPRGPMHEVPAAAATSALPQSTGHFSVETGSSQSLPSGPDRATGLPQGETPRGALPNETSNSRVAVPGKPYPKLNPATTTERTSRPIYPKPGAVETKPVTVSPEGEAHVQRPALKAPAPKTKAANVGAKAKKIMGGS